MRMTEIESGQDTRVRSAYNSQSRCGTGITVV